MFSIFKKKYSETPDLSGIGTDMHSHLLPGIDDGSPDVDVSESLIDGLKELGYRNFICTPHIMWDLYRNTPDTIQQAANNLHEHLSGKDKLVPFRPAAEYYMDEHFADLLEKKAPLLTIKDNWVLVEFSFVSPPINRSENFFQLQINGYRPILAHPERYNYLAGQREVFQELKDAGCLLQVNLLSFTGYYGKTAQELAEYLLKMNMIDLLGTDLHHHRHLEALRRSPRLNIPVNKLLDSGKLKNPEIK